MDEKTSKIIADLENQLANGRKALDEIWNSAIRSAMERFGVEHKPRCARVLCLSCAVREALQPLIRKGNINRKTPREIIGEFITEAGDNRKYIGKERKAYIEGLHDLFDVLIRKGLV